MVATVSPDAAVRLLPRGARVLATPACCTPETLLAAVGRLAGERPGMTVVSGMLLGGLPWLGAVRAGALGLRTWHATGAGRRLVDDGLADYVPMRLGDVPHSLAGAVDAMVLRVSPPDRSGTCSIGPSGSYTMPGIRAVRAAGGVVVGEIDADLPRTHGPTTVPAEVFDALVDADTPTCLYRPAGRVEAHGRIGELVVGLLPDSPTVQLGVGAVPEAVADALVGVAGGVRLVGMAGDGIAGLFDAGALKAGSGPSVTAVEVMGTAALMRLVDDNPAVEVVSSETVHDPRWIGSHDRFVSVNSALEVDLGGQVALESAGGRTLAGLGGAVDFFEGAHMSARGLRIVALRATDSTGRQSKIVPRLPAGTAVSLARHAVDVVVTEHGVARLTGRSLRERAEALVAVAAPEHRDALADGLGR